MPKANKIIYSARNHPPGAEKAIWLLLRDENVCTNVTEKEAFETGMLHGCFIEQLAFDERDQANKAASKAALESNARFVEPKEFREIEARKERERVSKAFAFAEKLIVNS